MRNKTRRGGAAVEFALLVPVVSLLMLSTIDIGFLAMHQFALERLCADTARALALSAFQTPDELRAMAEARLSRVSGPAIDAQVNLHAAEILSFAPPRDTKPIQVVELTLHQTVRPRFLLLRFFMGGGGFPLTSCVWEARIQP